MHFLRFLNLLKFAVQIAGKKAITAIKKLIKGVKIVFDNLPLAAQNAIQSVVDAYKGLSPGQKTVVKVILVLIGVGVAIGFLIALVKVFGPVAAVGTFMSWAWWLYQKYRDWNAPQGNEDWGSEDDFNLISAGGSFD